MVAIDVPIGLPQAVGLRECDREARARLGSRWMSVFEPPDRELFDHDFESARAVVCARRARDPRATFHVLTQQGVHILSKVAEVDEALREEPTRQDWLVEVHPEVSFREQAGEDLPRKKSGAGKARRREFLREQFPDIDVWLKPGRWPGARSASTICSMPTSRSGQRCASLVATTTSWAKESATSAVSSCGSSSRGAARRSCAPERHIGVYRVRRGSRYGHKRNYPGLEDRSATASA